MMAGSRYAVVGDPVAHSKSPRLFSSLARHLGLQLEYRAERVSPAEFPAFLARVREGSYQGLSVTLPHKEAALRLADGASESARAVGAANTLLVEGKSLLAHNTDAVGLVRALARHRVALGGARVLVLGAGGAARAAAAAARAAGAQQVWVANRTVVRAQRLAEAFGATAVPLSSVALAPLLPEVDVVVQATSAGLGRPLETALPAGCVLHARLAVVDMVYQPVQTALLRAAQAAGAVCVDGLWVLVHQAVEQLRLWTAVEAGPPLVETLHAELLGGAA